MVDLSSSLCKRLPGRVMDLYSRTPADQIGTGCWSSMGRGTRSPWRLRTTRAKLWRAFGPPWIPCRSPWATTDRGAVGWATVGGWWLGVSENGHGKWKKPARLLAIFSIVRYLMSLGNLMTIITITVLFFGVLRLGNQMSRRAFIDDLFLGCTWPCTWWTRKISHDFHQNVGTWWKIRRGNHAFCSGREVNEWGTFQARNRYNNFKEELIRPGVSS